MFLSLPLSVFADDASLSVLNSRFRVLELRTGQVTKPKAIRPHIFNASPQHVRFFLPRFSS